MILLIPFCKPNENVIAKFLSSSLVIYPKSFSQTHFSLLLKIKENFFSAEQFFFSLPGIGRQAETVSFLILMRAPGGSERDTAALNKAMT